MFEHPTACEEVSVGSARHIWIRVGQDTLRSDWKGGWEEIGEEHQSISVGADGVVFIVTSLLHPDAYEVQVYDPIAGKIRGGYGDDFKQVSHGTLEHIWGVKKNNSVFQYTGDGHWHKVSGALSQISVAADGTVCGVNHRDYAFILRGQEWKKLPGKLRQISAGSAHDIWGVGTSSRHQIFRLKPDGDWELMPGSMAQISVGADGTVLGIDPSKRLYRWLW